MALVVVATVAAVFVVGIAVFELVGWLMERNAQERFETMTPEESFKYQNDMRKAEM